MTYITIPDRIGGTHYVTHRHTDIERLLNNDAVVMMLVLECACCGAITRIPYWMSGFMDTMFVMGADGVGKRYQAQLDIDRHYRMDEARIKSAAAHFRHLPCNAKTVAHYYRHMAEQAEKRRAAR